MKHFALALLLAVAMTGSARADCDPYYDLYDRFTVEEDGVNPLRMSQHLMFDPNYKVDDRTAAANYVGYVMQTIYRGAEERQLHTLMECTRGYSSRLGAHLPGMIEIAYSAGWAGYLDPTNREALSVTEIHKRVDWILDGAEQIAADSGELAPVLGAERPVADSGVEGDWQGVELTLVIEGDKQVIPFGTASVRFEADGRYDMTTFEEARFPGQWHMDGPDLALADDETGEITVFAVAFQDSVMRWETSKHDGKWHEVWVWKRP